MKKIIKFIIIIFAIFDALLISAKVVIDIYEMFKIGVLMGICQLFVTISIICATIWIISETNKGKK